MCCQQGCSSLEELRCCQFLFPQRPRCPEDPVLALLWLLLALHHHERHGATRDSPTSADYVSCVVSETMDIECWVSFLQCACATWSQQSVTCADTPRIFLPLLSLRLRPGFLSSTSGNLATSPVCPYVSMLVCCTTLHVCTMCIVCPFNIRPYAFATVY